MNIQDYFRLDAPASAARIRDACIDNLTLKVSMLNTPSKQNYFELQKETIYEK